MANVNDLFYHGVRQQVRRVLEAMGPKRVEQGLSSFETGASNWSSCFFARAYPDLNLNSHRVDPEFAIAAALGMGKNRIPMRIVYHMFDGAGGKLMTRPQLLSFCRGFLDNKREPDVQKAIDDVLRQTDFSVASDPKAESIFNKRKEVLCGNQAL